MKSDDKQHIDTAEGWLELGNSAEAALYPIAPGVCEQPAVLEMQYHICVPTMAG